MPITCRFDLARKLIIAQISGVLTGQDIAEYQNEVWARPDVAGFNELIDMTGTTSVDLQDPGNMRVVAARAAAKDPPGVVARIAIVAPLDSVFGLARMYEAYRNMTGKGLRTVAVFRTLSEGLAFLGVADAPGPGDA